MVGVKGVGGIPEPTPERPSNVRNRQKNDSQGVSSKDGVRISSEAKQAADVARLLEIAKNEPDIRPERVAAAKQAIEDGEFLLPGAIAEVAKRISKLVT